MSPGFENRSERKRTYAGKLRVFTYWPFWLLLALVAALVILLIYSKEKTENIDRQLNDKPESHR